MNFICIIPARYSSTRFPGKPLAMLGKKTVIQHVYEKAKSAISDVWVATDDKRIKQAVESFGGKAIMTKAEHKSGTDRIEEAIEKIGDKKYDVVVNIQGDEPFIHKSQIETLCNCFDDDKSQIATLGIHFKTIEALVNPNSPKIVIDNQNFAMYFSRNVIPFIRGKERNDWINVYPYLKHIGAYAYRREVLRDITNLPLSSLEIAESLEQLRWLQNGFKIKVGLTNYETIGIDTPSDLEKAEKELSLQDKNHDFS
jgi:3-deoxy-manno-octulosonate cytidylyltransferase (CMP-KDO synthetase)